VGSGQRPGALRPVDDGLHDHLLVVHAGDVAAVADGMAGSGQREGVRAVEYLLTGREIELRLVVVKRFGEVDGDAVEGGGDRGEPVGVDPDGTGEPHSGEILEG